MSASPKKNTARSSSQQEFLEALQQFPREELRKRQQKLASLSLDLGIHYRTGNSNQVADTSWQFDIVPHILDEKEWTQIEAGLIQRARAFSKLLTDIYSEQRIFKERVIPHDLIFEDPAYLPECRNIPNPRHVNILLGAVDLVRDQNGQWFVSQNHFSTPFGMSFILQHRRMLSQAFPEIFQFFNVSHVSAFGTELVERLATLSEKTNPHIVLLSQGSNEETFFEESFLARRMGIAIVKPADLLVREGRVFLKTVRGLEQVDVIYRRSESRSLDPIAFRDSVGGGIPGLVNCARKGTVAIANALGCGVADNKALLRYSDSIIRYYLEEQPLLPTLPTYTCRDYDQLEYVRANRNKMLLRPVQRQADQHRWRQHKEPQSFETAMEKLLTENPSQLIAHVVPPLSEVPRFENGRILARPFYLRAFVLMGGNPMVLPGGLTRQSLAGDRRSIVANLAAGTKDTWVPDRKAAKASSLPASLPTKTPRDFKIASRVAESLYWIGRYTERAESTARMVRVLEELGWPRLSRRDRNNLWPLWQAVASTTGQNDYLKITSAPREVARLSRRLILERNDPASVHYCTASSALNAQNIREFITPEVWAVLSRISRTIEESSKNHKTGSTQLHEICQHYVDEIACLNGTILRTMPHDDSWEFYRLGMLLERAIGTVTILDIVMTRALNHLDPGAGQDPDLTSLLRLLSSLDAYQREYRSRTYVGQVAELLWCSTEAPSSVAYCCKHMVYSLRSVIGVVDEDCASPLNHAEAIMQHITQIRCSALFPRMAFDGDVAPPAPAANIRQIQGRVSRESDYLREHLLNLHEQIEDRFFSHQSGPPKN